MSFPQSNYPPPPPPAAPAVATPFFAGVLPVAAGIGVLGAILPWFKPVGTANGQKIGEGDAFHSWEDGRIGLIGPILMIVVAVSVSGLLRGRTPSRFAGSGNPLSSLAKWAVGTGLATAVCLGVAWAFVTDQYKFTDANGVKHSWDEVTRQGISLSKGPQIGFFLVGFAALLFIAIGVLLFGNSRSTSAPAAAFGTPGYAPPPPPAQYGVPQQGYPAPQAYPYQPPPQYGTQPQDPFGAPPQANPYAPPTYVEPNQPVDPSGPHA